MQPNENQGLLKAMHDTTATCWQEKVKQVYIKSKCVYSISHDTVNCWTQ